MSPGLPCLLEILDAVLRDDLVVEDCLGDFVPIPLTMSARLVSLAAEEVDLLWIVACLPAISPLIRRPTLLLGSATHLEWELGREAVDMVHPKG